MDVDRRTVLLCHGRKEAIYRSGGRVGRAPVTSYSWAFEASISALIMKVGNWGLLRFFLDFEYWFEPWTVFGCLHTPLGFAECLLIQGVDGLESQERNLNELFAIFTLKMGAYIRTNALQLYQGGIGIKWTHSQFLDYPELYRFQFEDFHSNHTISLP